MAKSDDAAKAPAGKGKLKLILLIVLGLLLAIGASVGGTWYIMHSSASKPAPVAAPRREWLRLYHRLTAAIPRGRDGAGPASYNDPHEEKHLDRWPGGAGAGGV